MRNPQQKFCSSIVDLIFRDLAMNYLGRNDLVHVPPKDEGEVAMNLRKTTSLHLDASGGMKGILVSNAVSLRW